VFIVRLFCERRFTPDPRSPEQLDAVEPRHANVPAPERPACRSARRAAPDAELQAIRAISDPTPDVHMLVGAVERKVRKSR
jgi:hypothetical protein